jgi:hypothetical protein
MVIGDLKADWPASRQLRLHAPRHVHSSRASAVGFATAGSPRPDLLLLACLVNRRTSIASRAGCSMPPPVPPYVRPRRRPAGLQIL